MPIDPAARALIDAMTTGFPKRPNDRAHEEVATALRSAFANP